MPRPLTYWLFAAVDRITPLGPEESYCLICWLAMVWLAWLTVSIVHRLTGLSHCVILLAWWLILIPRAPAVWKLPDSLFNSLDDGR